MNTLINIPFHYGYGISSITQYLETSAGIKCNTLDALMLSSSLKGRVSYRLNGSVFTSSGQKSSKEKSFDRVIHIHHHECLSGIDKTHEYVFRSLSKNNCEEISENDILDGHRLEKSNLGLPRFTKKSYKYDIMYGGDFSFYESILFGPRWVEKSKIPIYVIDNTLCEKHHATDVNSSLNFKEMTSVLDDFNLYTKISARLRSRLDQKVFFLPRIPLGHFMKMTSYARNIHQNTRLDLTGWNDYILSLSR